MKTLNALCTVLALGSGMRRAAVLAAGMMLGLGGCLERYETITVNADGSAVLKSVFKGDVQDVTDARGDAIPGVGSAWIVRDEPDAGDAKKMTRTAEMSVGAGQRFPSTYLALESDVRASRVLNFPTSVRVMPAAADERGVARTYYDFKRTYERREDARYTLARRVMEKDGAIKALEGKGPKELTEEDRVKIVRALARMETEKYAQFADAGVIAVGEEWPQEIGLMVRQAPADHVAMLDPMPFAKLLGEEESEDRNAKITAASAAFHDGLRDAVVKRMESLGVSKESQARFMSAAEAEANRRGVTEDLSDEKWEVRVTLPGVIIAHNGDRVEGNTVVWTFGAEHIMDRDQVLMASSRVDQGSKQP